MYSSCAFVSASPAGPGSSTMPNDDEHFGGLGAHDARLIDQPRQRSGASARSRSPIVPSAFTAAARTTGSGSAAAPISAFTIAGVTCGAGVRRRSAASVPRRRRRRDRRRTTSGVCIERAARCAAGAPSSTSCPMNSAALARTSRPCDRSTASRASAGSVVASPDPARYIVSASDSRLARGARRRPTIVHLLRRPLGRCDRRGTSCTRSARRTARCSPAPAAGTCDRGGESAAASSRRSCGS